MFEIILAILILVNVFVIGSLLTMFIFGYIFIVDYLKIIAKNNGEIRARNELIKDALNATKNEIQGAFNKSPSELN